MGRVELLAGVSMATVARTKRNQMAMHVKDDVGSNDGHGNRGGGGTRGRTGKDDSPEILMMRGR